MWKMDRKALHAESNERKGLTTDSLIFSGSGSADESSNCWRRKWGTYLHWIRDLFKKKTKHKLVRILLNMSNRHECLQWGGAGEGAEEVEQPQFSFLMYAVAILSLYSWRLIQTSSTFDQGTASSSKCQGVSATRAVQSMCLCHSKEWAKRVLWYSCPLLIIQLSWNQYESSLDPH